MEISTVHGICPIRLRTRAEDEEYNTDRNQEGEDAAPPRTAAGSYTSGQRRITIEEENRQQRTVVVVTIRGR